jgi:peptide/nickel transport system substrate-binding protein
MPDNHMLRRRDFVVRGVRGVVGTFVVGLAAACGPSQAPPAQSPATQPPAQQPAAQQAAQQAPTQAAPATKPTAASTTGAPTRVTVAQGVDPTVLDPDMHRETPTNNVIRHIYDALLDRDADGKLTPGLAESWKYTDDTTLQLTLKKGVTFSNGEPFNAEVAKYNLDRVTGKLSGAKATLNAANYASIGEVRALDPTTLEIKLQKPNPVLLRYLRDKYMVPMQYTKDSGFDALVEKPIGTGWYTLKEWTRSDHLMLVASQSSWHGKPNIDEVVFRPIPENATRVAELKTGNVDAIVNVPPDQVETLKAEQNVDVRTVPSARITGLFLNALDIAQLKDKRVRQALNFGVDVDSVCKNVMNGFASPVSTWATSFFVGYDGAGKRYTYDPTRAKQLLAEAGYADGFDAELLTPSGRYLNDVQVVQAIAGMLEKIGVRIRVNAVEFGVFAKMTQDRTIPAMFFAAWGNAPWDVYDTLIALVKTGGIFSWYSNPTVDDLVEKAGSTSDEAKHADYLKQALGVIWEDASHVFLYQQQDLYAASKRLKWQPRSDETLDMFSASL